MLCLISSRLKNKQPHEIHNSWKMPCVNCMKQQSFVCWKPGNNFFSMYECGSVTISFCSNIHQTKLSGQKYLLHIFLHNMKTFNQIPVKWDEDITLHNHPQPLSKSLFHFLSNQKSIYFPKIILPTICEVHNSFTTNKLHFIIQQIILPQTLKNVSQLHLIRIRKKQECRKITNDISILYFSKFYSK